MITAKIIEDSISYTNKRITTFQLMYPRMIHSELMTHRVFSRNASSSRAIPVKKMIDMVRTEPAMPIHWGKNQPGMQANEQLTGFEGERAKALWLSAACNAADIAERMDKLGLHKQVANRILEPFQHIHVVLTATEFSNWFDLRAHPDAQPEIQELAIQMRALIGESIPYVLKKGEWHLPYVTREERNDQFFKDPAHIEDLRKISAARCCRVSYLKHDGTVATIHNDIELCNKLAGSIPIHASPFEHQATPLDDPNEHSGNFIGWKQYRKDIEDSFKQS